MDGKRTFCFTGVSLVGLFLSLGTELIFKACVHADGSIGKCNTSQDIIFILGWLLVIIGAVAVFIKPRRIVDTILSVLSIALFGAIYAIPNVIVGICNSEHMVCRMLMLPAVNMLTLFGFVLSVFALINSFGGKKNE